MDDTDWAATGVFSPSKARLAQAQAKDWSYVDAWLSKKYVSTGRVPAFERNQDTLQTLLALISHNEAADEKRNIVERVEKAALQYYNKQKSEQGNDLLHELVDVSASEPLEVLAQMSVQLGVSIKEGVDKVAMTAVNLQLQIFGTEQAEDAAREQCRALKSENERLNTLLAQLRSDEFRSSSELVESTSQWLKGTKHLKAKIGEYEDRLAAARSSQSLLTLVTKIRELSTAVQISQQEIANANLDLQTLRDFPQQRAIGRKLISQAEYELHSMQARLQQVDRQM